MNIIEELSCDGVAPSGPVSAWPQERNKALMSSFPLPPSAAGSNASYSVSPHGDVEVAVHATAHATKVSANLGSMAKGLVQVAGQAVRNGRVTEEIRNERYDTCKACPFFIEDSKRCSECGCFMEAKTWIGGDPNTLCPKQKWSR